MRRGHPLTDLPPYVLADLFVGSASDHGGTGAMVTDRHGIGFVGKRARGDRGGQGVPQRGDGDGDGGWGDVGECFAPPRGSAPNPMARTKSPVDSTHESWNHTNRHLSREYPPVSVCCKRQARPTPVPNAGPIPPRCHGARPDNRLGKASAHQLPPGSASGFVRPVKGPSDRTSIACFSSLSVEAT